MDHDLLYKIAISQIQGIGGVLARNLIAYSGSVEAVFAENYQSLVKIPGIGEINARRIRDKKVFSKAEKELEFIQKNRIKVLFFTDNDYPRRLKACPDAPVVLFSRGKMNLNEERIISIVGTRHATDYGKMMCDNLIREFSERNYRIIVVSGLAYGIDVQAHKSSLRYGIPTVAVVGHGLDKIYPSLHAEVARAMCENGGVVTDFASGTKIDPANFIRRNRIVAGLADATVVVESAEKGGALITAEIAASYNRDVFAFPGRVDENYSRGCNMLIRKNGASLIQGIDDLEYFMGWEQKTNGKAIQQSLFVELSPEEEKITSLLSQNGELFIDQISAETGLPGSRVSSILLNMEFKNLLVALPGKMYKLR